ncbi:unnamed protein product [Arctogadus glacialis]
MLGGDLQQATNFSLQTFILSRPLSPVDMSCNSQGVTLHSCSQLPVWCKQAQEELEIQQAAEKVNCFCATPANLRLRLGGKGPVKNGIFSLRSSQKSKATLMWMYLN